MMSKCKSLMYKAMLVARGFLQRHNLDFNEIFALVDN